MTPAPTTLRVHQFAGLAPGPRLLVLGAVHGNETSGTQGTNRLLAELDAGTLTLACGTLTLVPITNPLAYLKQQRNGDRNLNRALGPTDSPREYEDQLANWLCPLLASHDVLLDLHSFQGGGQAFVMVGPRNNDGPIEPFVHADAEEALVRCLGVQRAVDGWLSTYAVGVEERRARAATQNPTAGKRHDLDAKYGVGTTEYMRSQGGYGLTLECGQHQDHWQAPMQQVLAQVHNQLGGER